MTAIAAEIILGFLTFTGSLMAAGKLQEMRWIPQRPVTYRGQNVVNLLLLAIAIGCGVALVVNPTWSMLFPAIIALSLLFGILLIIPIGGADMPTVISLLNSYAGLSAVAMGFVLDNKLLITAGALDGSSGFILSVIMCRAMNRSFTNVLFGAFGQVQHSAAVAEKKGREDRDDRRGRADPRAGAARRHHPRLRDGGGPGSANGPGTVRPVDQTRHRREVRHPSGCRPYARAT